MKVEVKSPLENISDNHWSLLMGQITYAEYLRSEGFTYTSVLPNYSIEDAELVKEANVKVNQGFIPWFKDLNTGVLVVGIMKNNSPQQLELIKNEAIKYKFKVVEVSDYDFITTYNKLWGEHNKFPQVPITTYVREIINIAIKLKASDITTYTDDDNYIKIMFRIKNTWEHMNLKFPVACQRDFIIALTNIDLNLHEHNKPLKMSSRFDADHIGRHTITFLSEGKIHSTTRISECSNFNLTMKDLNLSEDVYNFIDTSFSDKKGGLRIICGKPASGKNWTINCCLKKYVSLGNMKVVSIEYPKEFILPGVIQTDCSSPDDVRVNCEALTTQSPDVAYISETRDETAEYVLAASTTGNIVISTVHANQCADVLLRFHIMTGKSYDTIINILHSVVFQRLVVDKKEGILKPKCRYIYFSPEIKLKLYGKPIEEIYKILAEVEGGDDDIWDE